MANITPIHKRGPKHKKENYRQVSLTSIVCKVAEKIVRSRVTAFWSEHPVLNPHQFGYFHDGSLSRNNSKITDVVFLDLSKAFDSVPHERLLLKLNKYGIDGALLLWFRHFLTKRQQRVGIRGMYSSW